MTDPLYSPTTIVEDLRAVIHDERDPIANLANAAAILYHALPDVNWAGFYLLKDSEEELVLGPFQGKVACIRIPLGKGVCGTAALRREPVVVEDVTLFPGHIACDAASRSEIVIPLIAGGRLIGVMDIDSPVVGRFTSDDRELLEEFAAVLSTKV